MRSSLIFDQLPKVPAAAKKAGIGFGGSASVVLAAGLTMVVTGRYMIHLCSCVIQPMQIFDKGVPKKRGVCAVGLSDHQRQIILDAIPNDFKRGTILLAADVQYDQRGMVIENIHRVLFAVERKRNAPLTSVEGQSDSRDVIDEFLAEQENEALVVV